LINTENYWKTNSEIYDEIYIVGSMDLI